MTNDANWLKFQSFLWNGILTKLIAWNWLYRWLRSFNPSYEMESLRRVSNNVGNYNDYRFNPSYEMESLRSWCYLYPMIIVIYVSILLMKWNPYEVPNWLRLARSPRSFNPSYEMESLRSKTNWVPFVGVVGFQSFLWNGILTKFGWIFCYLWLNFLFQSFLWNGILTKNFS